MGLDVYIVKFNKDEFDKVASESRVVEYHDGCDLKEEIFYYRKHYSVKDLLGHVSGGTWIQCDFSELTESGLKRVIKLAGRLLSSNDDRWEEDELETLINDVTYILKTVDFNKEVIALSWVS